MNLYKQKYIEAESCLIISILPTYVHLLHILLDHFLPYVLGTRESSNSDKFPSHPPPLQTGLTLCINALVVLELVVFL